MIVNMYMGHFKEVTHRTTENPPRFLRRFVDNTFVVQWLEHREKFLKHINSDNQSINFSVEDT